MIGAGGGALSGFGSTPSEMAVQQRRNKARRASGVAPRCARSPLGSTIAHHFAVEGLS
jgi:hypothetical protein